MSNNFDVDYTVEEEVAPVVDQVPAEKQSMYPTTKAKAATKAPGLLDRALEEPEAKETPGQSSTWTYSSWEDSAWQQASGWQKAPW
eukprot:3851162-Amphidinium_carterae.1